MSVENRPAVVCEANRTAMDGREPKAEGRKPEGKPRTALVRPQDAEQHKKKKRCCHGRQQTAEPGAGVTVYSGFSGGSVPRVRFQRSDGLYVASFARSDFGVCGLFGLGYC